MLRRIVQLLTECVAVHAVDACYDLALGGSLRHETLQLFLRLCTVRDKVDTKRVSLVSRMLSRDRL